ncbi:MAG TPA: hypothetical protein VFO40_04745 [Chthoniobacterales bacterium]|nr:hypothetical protein [Chthoniobacterales bacterium]
MENIISLPYAGQLTERVRRESEVIARLRKQRASIQDRRNVDAVIRPNTVVAVNRQTERIYGLANLAAVAVMAAALITSFAIYLTSFVG